MDRPTLKPFTPYEIPGKPWGTELVIAHTPEYLGKVLWMAAGKKGAMQFHQTKKETFYLYRGMAIIRTKLEDGSVQEWPMTSGESYDVPPGAIHQVEAETDCVFFEASTPVFDDRQPA
jgi:mannose-6-phosphate isomerase-like protein (cupin superfamily)